MSFAGGVRTDQLNIFQRLGFLALLTFLFLAHGRVADRLSYLHLGFLSYCLAIMFGFVSGGILRLFSSRIGILLLALTAWMMAAASTSLWKGGSVELLKEHWVMSFMMYVLIVGLTLTYRQCRQAMHTMAYSVFALSLVAFVYGMVWEGRLYIPYSRFANPNELGQMLVIGLAFWWYIISDANLPRSRRVLAVLATVPMLIAAARTGSRATIIAFCVLLFQLFLRISTAGKIKLLMGFVLAVVLASTLLPAPLRERYFILFTPKTAEQLANSQQWEQMQNQAVGSSWARRTLLMTSIRMSLEHPIFGVGPGMFMVAEDMEARAKGLGRGIWQLTHNTYTEYSSECGLPALMFYLAAMYGCYRLLSQLNRLGRSTPGPLGADISNASLSLRLALTSFALAGMFGSFAYHMYFPVLSGLIVAWSMAAKSRVPEAVREQALKAARPFRPAASVLHPVWSRVTAGAAAGSAKQV
jgi:O-antigen ligase